MESPAQQPANIPPLDKFHEIEIGKIFDAMHSLQQARIQMGTFFGTVNLTALGIGFSTQRAGIIFIASLLPIIFLCLDTFIRGPLYGYYYRAYQLHQQFAPFDDKTFLIMFRLFLGTRVAPHIEELSKRTEQNDVFRTLARLPRHTPTSFGFWLPLAVSLIEAVLG
jgi:hypothetical protein